MGIGSGPPVGFFPERLLSEKEKEMTNAIAPQRSNPMNREELVEEIAARIFQAYEIGCLDGVRAVYGEDRTSRKPGMRRKAEYIISRISQAIENGELKLAREVGRGIYEVGHYVEAIKWKLGQDPWEELNGDSLKDDETLLIPFIALRPESHRDPRRGGQEEE